jgi:hypothetical protein
VDGRTDREGSRRARLDLHHYRELIVLSNAPVEIPIDEDLALVGNAELGSRLAQGELDGLLT